MNYQQALIVLDVQKFMFIDKNNPVFNEKEFLNNIKNLINKARDKDIPIIYIQHNGESGTIYEQGSETWEVHDDLHLERPPGAFLDGAFWRVRG